MQASIDKVNQLKDEGKIEVHTKYQLGSVSGNEKVESINIKHDDESIKEIKTDYVLGFFGLIMQLGPIAEWGLNLDKKTIPLIQKILKPIKKVFLQLVIFAPILENLN